MDSKSEIILYQPDNEVRLEVRLEDETVWLTQAQMAELFQTSRNNITIHINNIFKEQELQKESVCKESLLTATDGKYPPIGIHTCRRSHDRFLIVDNSDVYHIGASLKDLGKKMFAFSKMGIPAGDILALAVSGG